MKYADGGGSGGGDDGDNELRCHATKNCTKGNVKMGVEKEKKWKETKRKRTAWQAQEKRQQAQRASGRRKQLTVVARHAEGQLCRMRCQQRRTRGAEGQGRGVRERLGGRGMGECRGSDNRQQEHKYYKQFNIILMPCHVVLCLGYAASSATPTASHARTHKHSHTPIHIYMRVYLPCK